MRYRMADAGNGYTLEARIPACSAMREGEVHVGEESRGIVLFAHGSGSSRHSPRNQLVARSLRARRLGTLLFDLLTRVKSQTLLIVGGLDEPVIKLNEDALARLSCEEELRIVPAATHLFEEHGALDEVARLAGEWFGRHLHGRSDTGVRPDKAA
jgi:hypothetical protein